MENLPTELRQQIIQHLDLTSLKSIRLASKSWAFLGEEYLLAPTFTALPHRDDFHRLLSLSYHPRLPTYVRSLVINLGEINEYHARHNTYFLRYMQDPETRLLTTEAAWGFYSLLKVQKESVAEYCCDPEILSSAFQRLKNLTAIEVTLSTYPFEDLLLREIWKIPSTRLLPRVSTTERLTAVLLAVHGGSVKDQLRSLSHDRLPFEFFTQKQEIMKKISESFQNLQSLKLTIDYSDLPNDLHKERVFQRLGECLPAAKGLRELSLGF